MRPGPRWLALGAWTSTVLLASSVQGAPRYHPGVPAAAPDAVLPSQRVELHLFKHPYRFELVDRAAKTVVLRQRRTEFLFGRSQDAVVSASSVSADSESLTASVASGGKPLGTIQFRFDVPDRLQVTLQPSGGATGVAEAFVDQGERYYGLWEYPFARRLDNRGLAAPLVSPGYQKDAHHASARAPFYVTSGGYGVYARSDAWSAFHLAVAGETGFRFRAASLTYYVLYGPGYGQVLQQYQQLAGPAAVPPTWALGTMWWRDDAHKGLRPGVRDAAENVLDDARQLQDRRIPSSALWIDRPFASGSYGWGTFDFDTAFHRPEQLVAELHDRGMQLMLWSANRFWKLPKPLESTYTIRGPRGRVLDVRRNEPSGFLEQGMRRYADLGVAGYKVDRGDEGEIANSLQNAMSTPLLRTLHNSFPPRERDRSFLIARNVYDTGRSYSAVWNGDVTSSFGGLRMSVKNALRSGMLEFPAWGSDTGGLLSPWGKPGNARPDKELLARWLAFSAYSPIMEVLIGPGRTPWLDYDDQLQEVTRQYAGLHHDLIPFTRSALSEASRTGMPVMQPLVFSYPDDPHVADRWDEYLYGGQLLVAPVLNSLHGGLFGRHVELSIWYLPRCAVEPNVRSVYLPRGRWLDYTDRATALTGPCTLHVRPALNKIPVYAREGAIVPRGDVFQGNNNWSGTWRPHLRIELFPAATADSTFNYDPGEDAEAQRGPRPIRCVHQGSALEISCPDLRTPGEFEVYCRQPAAVERNGVLLNAGDGYAYDPATHCLRVPFSGATRLRLLGASSLFTVPGPRA